MRIKGLASLAAAFVALGCARAAERTGPVAVAPGAETFHVGALEVVALRDAEIVVANDGGTFGVDAGPAAVAAVLKAAGAPTGHLTLDVDALLVKGGGRIMLFDAGFGASVHGALVGSLAKAGVSPGEVTDVLLTHSHHDHTGGLVTAAGALAFPNAVIHMSSLEWGWMETQSREAALVKLLGPKVKPFTPGLPLFPGVTPVAMSGHTPGHVGYEIVSGEYRLMDIGDTAHSAIVSLARPAWMIGYDNNPVEGRTSRMMTLALLAKNHELVFAPHFPFPGIGHIEKAGEGYLWRPQAP